MSDNTCTGGVIAAHPLFHAGGGGQAPTSVLQLHFAKIDLELAKKLNRLWHSRFPENGGGGSRVCYGAEAGGEFWAAAIWTNPTSPKLPQLEWLMLKRFAIRTGRPKNTASRMMGWMIRDVYRRFPEVVTLVSYSDPDSHVGAIYTATGWNCDGASRRAGPMWHNRGREHTANAPCRRVVRWLKNLRLWAVAGCVVCVDSAGVLLLKNKRLRLIDTPQGEKKQ